MNGIVFGGRSLNRTGPGQVVARQLPVVNLRERKEFVTLAHDAPGVLTKDSPGIVTVHMLAYEFSAPGERPHDSIVIFFCMRNLARTHPSSEHPKNLRTGGRIHPKGQRTPKSSRCKANC